jgi:hypothetical protein
MATCLLHLVFVCVSFVNKLLANGSLLFSVCLFASMFVSYLLSVVHSVCPLLSVCCLVCYLLVKLNVRVSAGPLICVLLPAVNLTCLFVHLFCFLSCSSVSHM